MPETMLVVAGTVHVYTCIHTVEQASVVLIGLRPCQSDATIRQHSASGDARLTLQIRLR